MYLIIPIYDQEVLYSILYAHYIQYIYDVLWMKTKAPDAGDLMAKKSSLELKGIAISSLQFSCIFNL